MKVFAYSCQNCGYASRHLLGTPAMDQVLTDVNDEFADFRLFCCTLESRFISVDVLSSGFTGLCPSDGSDLIDVPDTQTPACPRCHSLLAVGEELPLSVSNDKGGSE
ncbi:MAG: hypothetical protein ABI361_07775 [Nitrososphaera sp.]